jgi:hypothetical protein
LERAEDFGLGEADLDVEPETAEPGTSFTSRADHHAAEEGGRPDAVRDDAAVDGEAEHDVDADADDESDSSFEAYYRRFSAGFFGDDSGGADA